jgi:hypothetical protein
MIGLIRWQRFKPAVSRAYNQGMLSSSKRIGPLPCGTKQRCV